MVQFNAHIDVHLDPDDLLAQANLEPGGLVQRIIDERVYEYCRPYVPTSPRAILVNTPSIASQFGSGQVVWDTPYARYQYYGKVMTDELGRTWVGAGEHKPIITDRDLEYDKSQAPMAGAYWFPRMLADRLNDILDEARRAVAKGLG